MAGEHRQPVVGEPQRGVKLWTVHGMPPAASGGTPGGVAGSAGGIGGQNMRAAPMGFMKPIAARGAEVLFNGCPMSLPAQQRRLQ